MTDRLREIQAEIRSCTWALEWNARQWRRRGCMEAAIRTVIFEQEIGRLVAERARLRIEHLELTGKAPRAGEP